MAKQKILIWLPSPMGDAVMATPALKAFRAGFKDAEIFFLAGSVVRQILSPTELCDGWIDSDGQGPLKLAIELSKHKFSTAILLKNSFSCALTIFLARIKQRIGYARDGRSWMLTDKVQPQKNANGTFTPAPMIDYYLALASYLDFYTDDRQMTLDTDSDEMATLLMKMPTAFCPESPLVILVPGGAFGPSKCWPAERFAQVSDWLVENYHANIVVSVSPNKAETKIAQDICDHAKHDIFNLADTPLTLGQLKCMLNQAHLVITNDTGPRHIAIALEKNLITMFGPNNPEWTQPDYDGEIQIVGKAACVPCDKPICKAQRHYCMESITVETICDEAARILDRIQL